MTFAAARKAGSAATEEHGDGEQATRTCTAGRPAPYAAAGRKVHRSLPPVQVRPGAPFKKFALQQGETVFAAIERMARYRGLVVYSPGDGSVRIGPADRGERTGQITEGVNVKSAEGTDDVSERFSEYLVKGQAAGDDQRHGKVVAQVKGTATDSGVTRHRPLLLIGEEQSDTASLKKRAAWEAAVRSGKGKPLDVEVPGWLTDAGKVWSPGARAACDIPSCKVSGDLLVQSVTLARNETDGTVTSMTLVPPEAWSQLAEPEEKA